MRPVLMTALVASLGFVPKLSDFGLTKSRAVGAQGVQTQGTYAYMAPEVLEDTLEAEIQAAKDAQLAEIAWILQTIQALRIQNAIYPF